MISLTVCGKQMNMDHQLSMVFSQRHIRNLSVFLYRISFNIKIIVTMNTKKKLEEYIYIYIYYLDER